jgi:regulatory protein
MPLSFSQDELRVSGFRQGALIDLSREAEPPADKDDPYRKAMEKAGRVLARRPHSRSELALKLRASGIEPEAVDRAMIRLEELGLIDDLVFARQWVEERGRRRGAGLLRAELARKGVPREVADQALADVGLDEDSAALALAAGWLRRVVNRPLAEQAQRIRQMLVRRGYSHEVAEEATRAVLPPEGWD